MNDRGILLAIAEDLQKLADDLRAVMSETNAAEPEKAPEQTPQPEKKKELTLVEVRPVLAAKCRSAGRDAVLALLRKYGAEALSGVVPSDYEALLKDAEELPDAAE